MVSGLTWETWVQVSALTTSLLCARARVMHVYAKKIKRSVLSHSGMENVLKSEKFSQNGTNVSCPSLILKRVQDQNFDNYSLVIF